MVVMDVMLRDAACCACVPCVPCAGHACTVLVIGVDREAPPPAGMNSIGVMTLA